MDGGPVMRHRLHVGTVVEHDIFGQGSVVKIYKSGREGLTVVVRFSDLRSVTATFSILDVAKFLTIRAPGGISTDPGHSQPHRPRDANKARIKELEAKLAHKATDKKPPR